MDIQKIKAMVARQMDLILQAQKDLWMIPEVGYKEYKTDAYLKAAFRKLGYELTEADGITGFFTVLDTEKAGPTVLVLAELDALYCADHPDRDKKTNAVHACGHHAQCATILGIAAALKEENALDGLSGRIKFCLVPAEEGIEIDYRMDLIKQGKISFASGKQEFLVRGYFDDVDLAFMVHVGTTEGTPEGKLFRKYKGYNGVIRKIITIKGKAAHAGDCPYLGVNALNASALAITAVSNLRETFRESDFVRFHPIITKGGDAVNAVPAEVVMQSYVRAATTEALNSANKRINRAISAAAAANGCSVVISDIAGSEPFHEDERLTDLYKEVCEAIGGKACVDDKTNVWEACSTDMGDLAVNFPAIHPYSIGATGAEHGSDYKIPDPEKVCGNSAILQLGLLYCLLENDAEKAKEVKANYNPVFPTIADYVFYKKTQTAERETVLNNADGSITIL